MKSNNFQVLDQEKPIASQSDQPDSFLRNGLHITGSDKKSGQFGKDPSDDQVDNVQISLLKSSNLNPNLSSNNTLNQMEGEEHADPNQWVLLNKREDSLRPNRSVMFSNQPSTVAQDSSSNDLLAGASLTEKKGNRTSASSVINHRNNLQFSIGTPNKNS